MKPKPRLQSKPYSGVPPVPPAVRPDRGRGVVSRRWCHHMAIVSALISILISGCASRPADPWWGPDKAAHLVVSTAISAAATRIAMDAGVSAPQAHAQAVGVVLVIGAGKEAYDGRPGGTGWSWRDMSWNLLGALLGGALVRAAD